MPVLQARVPDEEAELFRAYAEREGMSLSKLIRLSVREHITSSPGKLRFGTLKGRITIADDFGETPEDIFKEYI
jgi:hypothetical protein